MKLLAGAAVLLAIGAGLGTYFALAGASHEHSPVGKRDPILEAALNRGIISGYRTIPRLFRRVSYHVAGSDITVEFANACGDQAGMCFEPAVLRIEYGRESRTQAQRLLRLAQTRWSGKVKSFETKGLNSHTPDARIMLIPKAGA